MLSKLTTSLDFCFAGVGVKTTGVEEATCFLAEEELSVLFFRDEVVVVLLEAFLKGVGFSALTGVGVEILFFEDAEEDEEERCFFSFSVDFLAEVVFVADFFSTAASFSSSVIKPLKALSISKDFARDCRGVDSRALLLLLLGRVSVDEVGVGVASTSPC